jgi:tetratricopeptide (TPR) repeat protein
VPRLVITRGNASHAEIALTDCELRVGRSPDNDIVLDDPGKAVSRHHACLKRGRDGYELVDAGSDNGIWMNGVRMPQAHLDAGAVASIGPYRLSIEEDPVPAVESAAPPQPSALPDTVPGAPAPRKRPAAHSGASTGDLRPGPIGWLARQPKPVVFGGFFVFVVLIIGLRVLTSTPPQTVPVKRASQAPAGAEPQQTPRNDDSLASHLKQAEALIDKGDFDGAINGHLSRALLLDPGNAAALELKTRAEELKARAAAATPTVTVIPPVNPPPVDRPDKPVDRVRDSAANRTASDVKQPARENKAARRPSRNDQHYAIGLQALGAGNYATAISEFEAIERDAPGYKDVAARLAEAQQKLDDTIRAAALAGSRKALADGAHLEKTGDLAGALRQYESARSGDPAAAELSVTRLRARMKTEGADAYKKAKVYDAVGRTTEAIALYEKAVQFLPADDPTHRLAEERLATLRTPK